MHRNCKKHLYLFFSSVQFSRPVVSYSLLLHESQHTRPPCPSPTLSLLVFSHSLLGVLSRVAKVFPDISATVSTLFGHVVCRNLKCHQAYAPECIQCQRQIKSLMRLLQQHLWSKYPLLPNALCNSLMRCFSPACPHKPWHLLKACSFGLNSPIWPQSENSKALYS